MPPLPQDPIVVSLTKAEQRESLKFGIRQNSIAVFVLVAIPFVASVLSGWTLLESVAAAALFFAIWLGAAALGTARVARRGTTVAFDTAGFDVTRGRRHWRHEWSKVRRVAATDAFVYLFLRRGGFALPKRCFAAPGDADAVIAAASQGMP